MTDHATKDDIIRLENKLDKIADAINGNGRPGIKTDVAVLKSSYNNRKVREGVYLAGFVALIGNAIWDWISK